MTFFRRVFIPFLALATLAFLAQAETYEYDQYNRVGKVVYEDGSAIEYTYDNAGNRLAQVVSPVSNQFELLVNTDKGRVLPNVRAYAFNSSGRYSGIFANTDDQGLALFELKDFIEGSYTFRVDYLGSQFWTPLLALPGTRQYALVIPEQTCQVTVQVAGTPKPGVRVYLFSKTGTYLGLYAVTDDQGQASFDLPVGTEYTFRADTLGNRYWSEPVIIGSQGATYALVNAGGGVLNLFLEKEPGNPLSGIKTYVFNSTGAYLGLTAISDINGLVSYTLSQGLYKIRMDYLGYQFWSEPISVTQDLDQTLSIPHQDVNIRVQTDYNDTLTPKPGLRIYLYNNTGAYVGQYRTTDSQGQGTFNLPQQEYKVRVDYLSQQFWFEPFVWQDQELVIPEGLAQILVTNLEQPLQNIKVYAFNPQGTYLGLVQTTNALGQVQFQIPEGQYKFRADYLSNQYWSDICAVTADTITPLTLSTGGGHFTLQVMQDENSPMVGIKCYLFNDKGTYLGRQANTNDQGRVSFNPSNGIYKIRVDYLGYQYWTQTFSIPDQSELIFDISHQEVAIRIGTRYLYETQALSGVKTYLYTSRNAYQGQSRTTDDQGLVYYNLPQKEYKLRADYLGYQFWSAPFTWINQDLDILHGKALVHVTRQGQALANARVYLFKPDNTYQGRYQTTDANGLASFLLPNQAYKFRVDFNSIRYWSSAVTIMADQEIGVEVGVE